MLILDLKPLRSWVKGKHTIGREFQSLAVHARKETVDIDILLTFRNVDGKIIQSIRITSRPISGIRKWNQFNQVRSTFTTVIPVKKTFVSQETYQIIVIFGAHV